ncbi:MAG: ferrous iron transport protein B [Ignisphaera sp.]
MNNRCIYCPGCSYPAYHTNLNEVVKRVQGCDIVVSIIAQPNIGKSTLFTRITGKISHVANFPGTTVDIRIGEITHKGKNICFVDLPGIYGLSTTSIDETIAREFIASGIADVHLVLLDPLNLDRSLYLALQVLEITPRVIIAITKWDIVHSKGVHIHLEGIQRALGVPIVAVSSITGEGIQNLLNTILDVIDGRSIHRDKPIEIDYGVLETYIGRISSIIKELGIASDPIARWLAIRALEDDTVVLGYLKSFDMLYRAIELSKEEIRLKFNRDSSELIVERRYQLCEEIAKATSVRVSIAARTNLIDKIFQHPITGFTASILILFATFMVAFIINTGFPLNMFFSLMGFEDIAKLLQEYTLSGLIARLFSVLSQLLESYLPHGTFLVSFLVDGIIAGVGAVITFLPLVFLVIFLQSALEDSGIGPRMALALHSLFAKFGLSGRAVYPMLIAVGCNVPAVLSSRVAIDSSERLEIAMNISFIPCQARLLVLLAFTSVLFRNNPLLQALAITTVYGIGILLYLTMSKLFRIAVFKRKDDPELLLEIPPLHRPSIRVMMWNSWDLTKHFLYKAAVVILILSIVMWTLLNFGPQGYTNGDITRSYGVYIGGLIAPLFSSLFNIEMEAAWRLGLALFAGFIAKEGLISTLAVMSSVEESRAIETLGLTLPQGFSILLLFMFYIPCVATAVAIYSETKSYRYSILVVLYLFTTSIFISLIAYAIMHMV